MALTQTRIVGPTQLTTSVQTLYTVGASETTIVKQIMITNVTATAATATIHLVPSGGTPTNANKILAEVGVFANETTLINTALVMNTGDSIRALAGTGSALNLTISGIVESS